MIDEIKKGSLIVISAPSGAGKGTIINELLKNNTKRWLSVSTTSRKMRSNDIPGVTYNFVSEEEFLTKIKENYFIEYTNYAGNYYGTPKSEIINKLNEGIDVILEIEVEGAKNIQKIFKDAICIFVMPPSLKELAIRLKKRATDQKDKIRERIKKAYQEINEVYQYNYIVVNDNLDEAILKIEAIITSEKCRVARIKKINFDMTEKEIDEFLIDEDVNNEIINK